MNLFLCIGILSFGIGAGALGYCLGRMDEIREQSKTKGG